MKKMKILSIFLSLLFFCVSFSTPISAQNNWMKSKWNTTTNTTFSQLTQKRYKGKTFILKKDSFFTGTAWSNDGRSVRIKVKDGTIYELCVYHSNGNVAWKAIINAGNQTDYLYDESGNTISANKFSKLYPYIELKLKMIEEQMRKS